MQDGAIRFMQGLWGMPIPVRIWVVILGAVNMVGSLFFLDRIEARWILVSMLAAGMIMIVLTALDGFTRLLGLGHFVWFLLIPWLITRLALHPPTDSLGIWIRAVIVLNSISLVIDVIDVVRWIRGERAEVVETR